MKLIITMIAALSMVPAAVSAFELQGVGAAGVKAMTEAVDIPVPAAPESSEAWKSLPSGGDAAAIQEIPTSVFAEGANAELRGSLRIHMKPGASPNADAIVEVRGIGLGDIPPDYSVKSIAVYEGDTGRLVAAAETPKLVSNIFSWGKRVQTYSLEILKKDLDPARNYVFAAEVAINGSYYWPVRSGFTAVQVANKFERGYNTCLQDDNSGVADHSDQSGDKAAPMEPRDVFASVPACSILTVAFDAPPNLNKAVRLLAPCLEYVSGKYGVRVSASHGAMPYPEVIRQGIILNVHGPVPVGNTIVRDLRHSVARRGQLVTWPAHVEVR